MRVLVMGTRARKQCVHLESSVFLSLVVFQINCISLSLFLPLFMCALCGLTRLYIVKCVQSEPYITLWLRTSLQTFVNSTHAHQEHAACLPCEWKKNGETNEEEKLSCVNARVQKSNWRYEWKGERFVASHGTSTTTSINCMLKKIHIKF